MKIAVRRVLLLSALLGPGTLYALGLGEIKLNSALNQPFDAEIELVSATQDDLGALRASLASNDTFVRYGLDRPAYLFDFNFQVAKGAGGKDVLRVTSPRPVTEPFVTLLVEANWPRGRLLREYTVLLDPPVYTPAPATPQPVAAAPRVASGGATTARPAAPVAPAANEPARAPRESSAPARSIEPGSEYRVRPRDTLWQIASAANPGSRSDVNRAMVSIYQSNPHAFDGNINVLRSGSSLRIPDAEQIRSVSAAEASAEVARQYDAWRNGRSTAESTPVAAAETGRLRLVPPQQGTVAPSTATATTPGATPGTASGPGGTELEARVRQLETELSEARRLLEVRNAELATLQGGPSVPVEGETTPAATTDGAATDAEAPAEAAPAAAAAAVDPPKKAAKKRPVEPPAPTLFERITDYWWVLLGLLGLGLGALLFQRLRRERGNAESSLEEALGPRETRSNMRFSPRPRDADIVVEEKRGVEAPGRAAPAVAALPEATRKVSTVADTLSGDGPASLESGDPLAEADFHMAYGLYDQAADLVQLAMKREPQRRDLKLKLLEIFFVWGNKDKFLELAGDLHSTRAEAPAGEWDKVLIMGKQIAPGDALFAGNLTSASTDSLDMELHSATSVLDIEIPAGISGAPDMDMDMDLTETDAETAIAPVDRSGLDFVFDEPVRGAEESSVLPTIEMPQFRKPDETGGDTQELTVDRLGLDLDMGALRGLDGGESLDANEAIETRRRTTSDTVETASMSSAKSLLDDDNDDLLTSTALMRMADDTSLLPRDESLEALVDLSDATGELPSLDATEITTGVDFDLGGEPATMSEVGTKLDLARAYMDMGDPEGARSILDEVLQEGSATQRQEAERLIASLP
jgi:pilus assembly protein FimV